MKTAVIIAVVISGFIVLPTPLKLIIMIVDFLVPDPIPFADEIVMLISLFLKYGLFADDEGLLLGIKAFSFLVMVGGILLLVFYF